MEFVLYKYIIIIIVVVIFITIVIIIQPCVAKCLLWQNTQYL